MQYVTIKTNILIINDNSIHGCNYFFPFEMQTTYDNIKKCKVLPQ